MTRGRHLVKKVLATACKTFGISKQRARLVLCVSTEEGGETHMSEFVCPEDETMFQCGIVGNSKLFVRVVTVPDQLEEDSDEELEYKEG